MRPWLIPMPTKHRSAAYLNRAIERKPNYAEAYARLARAEIMLRHMLAVAPQEAFPAAQRAAAKAIAWDETLAGAHAVATNVKFLYEWDFPSAEREFLRAIGLDTNSQSAVFCLAVACYTLSWREAEDEKRHHQGRKDTWW
jgi:hypothetical protein